MTTFPAQPPTTARTLGERIPDLGKSERILFGVAIALAATVSVLGLLSSFKTLEDKAGQGAGNWGWDWPWLLPVGIDLAIPAFTLISLLLIRTNMPLVWVAWVPRALTGATVYLNWEAASTLPGQIGHAVLTLLWVVFSEIAGHVYASYIGAVTGERLERVRRVRWVLAPISTLFMWRRMRLWEARSYGTVVQHQRDTAVLRARLRTKHGLRWRSKATRAERLALRLAKFGTPVSETLNSETETITARTETSRPETRETNETAETKVSPSRETSETETATKRRDRSTETSASTETSETETSLKVSLSKSRSETAKVTAIGDRETETTKLLDLMKSRGGEMAVSLDDAIAETGRPKSTAAKRLKAARDLYLAETA